MTYLIILGVATLLLCIASGNGAPLVIAAIPAYYIIRNIRMKKYFASEEFLSHKEALAEVVKEYNELSGYVDEMRQKNRFALGSSSSGANAHLASFQNTSNYAYRRDRNVANYGYRNVHNASLQVVRNSAADPIKYLTKYFGIESTEDKLAEVESLGDSISRMENAIQNLKEREASISNEIKPPAFILKHYLRQFREQVGISLPALTVPYPVYSFEYVSAGGNSSQVTTIQLNAPTIDALIGHLSEKIKFRKSAKGQRALMTARLRQFIKDRDNHTCQICRISTFDEQHLLLEIDHIVPVSKGGLTEEINLQTLCWKCNRTKSNKVS